MKTGNYIYADRITPTIRRAERMLNKGDKSKASRTIEVMRMRAANSDISLYPWEKRLKSLDALLFQ